MVLSFTYFMLAMLEEVPCKCLVASKVKSKGAHSWYDYWKGVDVVLEDGRYFNICDKTAEYNGYGGFDVTGAHYDTKFDVIAGLRALGFDVDEVEVYAKA